MRKAQIERIIRKLDRLETKLAHLDNEIEAVRVAADALGEDKRLTKHLDEIDHDAFEELSAWASDIYVRHEVASVKRILTKYLKAIGE